MAVNAWSDAAREAALEARRSREQMSSWDKNSPQHAAHARSEEAFGHSQLTAGKFAWRQHEDSQTMHEQAEKMHRSNGNNARADLHKKWADYHQHEAAALRKQTIPAMT